MEERRTKIKSALRKLVEDGLGRYFQNMAFALARKRWPQLFATEPIHDGGEDGITILLGSGQYPVVSLACSLSGNLTKIKQDCRRIADRGKKIDLLVFYTPVAVTEVKAEKWRKEIMEDFGHDIRVISQAAIIGDLEQPENAWICREYLELDFEEAPDVQQILPKARKAALIVLNGWKAVYKYDRESQIELSLKTKLDENRKGLELLDVTKTCETIRKSRQVVLKGPPGAGKTITLIQIAERLIEDVNGPVPLLVSLPEWSSDGHNLLAFIEASSPFAAESITKSDLAALNNSGRLIFLLNGWNEIRQERIESTSLMLRGILSGSPSSAFVVTTRGSNISPPLNAEIIHIEPLSSEQRRDIVSRSKLAKPSALIETIENRSFLDRITRTPLFLSGVIEIAERGGEIPESRYGIIKALIRNAESEPEHQSALERGPCGGNHRYYLSHMAFTMSSNAGTNSDKRESLVSIAEGIKELKGTHLIESSPDPSLVLESLTQHHLLVRSGVHDGSFRFVHQQFQEWFSAERLYREIVDAAKSKDHAAVFRIQQEIINLPTWEQPLFFVIDRLMDEYAQRDSVRHAADIILWTIPVDLVFAARLDGRAGEKVWPHVKKELSSALRSWYALPDKEHKECALSAILATASPDFADIILPLLENEDQQVRLGAYRNWPFFPPSVIGQDWAQRVKLWSEEQREDFVIEISSVRDKGRLSFAAELARNDPSPSVRGAALVSLGYMGAGETLIEILNEKHCLQWPTETLPRILDLLPTQHIISLATRLRSALADIESPNAREAILAKLNEIDDPQAVELMKNEIGRDEPTAALRTFVPRIYARDPAWVSEWMVEKLLRGELWEEEWADYLKDADAETMKRLGAVALDRNLGLNTFCKRLRIFSKVNAFASRLVADEYLKASAESDARLASGGKRDYEEHLRSEARDEPIEIRVDAVLDVDWSQCNHGQFARLIGLIAPGSPWEPSYRETLSEEQSNRLRERIFEWADSPLVASDTRGELRAELASLLGCVGRPEDVKVIEGWIVWERQRMDRECKKHQEWVAGGRKGKSPGDRCTGHMHLYASAVAALNCKESIESLIGLLSDPEYIGEASRHLARLTQSGETTPLAGPFPKKDYKSVFEERERRASQRRLSSVVSAEKRFALAIQNALSDLLDKHEAGQGDGRWLYGLCEAGKALAQLGEEDCVSLILRLAKFGMYEGCVSEALETLVLKGVTVPGKETLEAVNGIISRAESERVYNSNQDKWPAAQQCLFALLFSDSPRLGTERIRRVPPEKLHSYHTRDLVKVLGLCQAPEAGQFLLELASNGPVLSFCFSEWITALADSGLSEARRFLINILDDVGKGTRQLRMNGFDAEHSLIDAISRAATEDKGIWNEIENRCFNTKGSNQRQLLSEILWKVRSDEAALEACYLIRDDESLSIPLYVEHLIKVAMTDIEEHAGSLFQNMSPRSFNGLRERLFDLALNDKLRKKSAVRLLVSIEAQRLWIGRPNDEPRHPQIDILNQTLTPWPLLPTRLK